MRTERQPFINLTSRIVPLVIDNVDTDQIIPARFLKRTDKNGLGSCLFADWKDDANFILNQPEATGARILLAGENFGCGSSREHAPWALSAWGFQAIVALSFADIFRNNALKNGILPVEIQPAAHTALAAARAASSALTITIDLSSQTVLLPGGMTTSFPMDPFARHCLLNGIDELAYLLGFEAQIGAHEAKSPPLGWTPDGQPNSEPFSRSAHFKSA